MKGVANMASPKISFYMTVRNGERFVRPALQSIKAQDIDCWEAVIIDDGSSDSTVSILDSFSAEDPRFRVEHTTGVGRGRALNQAISLCRAEILTNLDADDLAHPQRARVLLETMGKYPDFDVIAGRSQIIFDDEVAEWILEGQSICSVHDVTRRLAYTNPVGHSSMGLRRPASLSVGCYDENRVSQFDYDLWVRLVLAGYRVASTDIVLAAKRSHSDQSYERKSHLRYTMRSVTIQWRAIRGLGVNQFVGAFGVVAHIVWACLPVKVRMWVRRIGLLK